MKGITVNRQPRNRRERGATGIEYGLIAALIAVVVISVVTMLGGNLSGVISGVNSALTGLGAGGADPTPTETPTPTPTTPASCTYTVNSGSYDTSQTILVQWTSDGSCARGFEQVVGAARVQCVNGDTFAAFQENRNGLLHAGDNYQCNFRGGVAAFYSDGMGTGDTQWNAWRFDRDVTREAFTTGIAPNGSGATCVYSLSSGIYEGVQTAFVYWASNGCGGNPAQTAGAVRVECSNGETFAAYQENIGVSLHVGDNYQCNSRGGVTAFYSEGSYSGGVQWNAWRFTRAT